MDLRNKNIIVTGGASGLGEALALEFLKKDANVLISDINSKNLKVTANKLECEFEYCDVSKEKDVQNLVEKAFKEIWSYRYLLFQCRSCFKFKKNKFY